MQNLLNDIILSNVFAFLLIFTRFGTAMIVMPGIGESFITPQVRLLFALSISFVLMPFLAPNLPTMPSSLAVLTTLLMSEMLIGFFIGVMMRIMVSALDTAGAVISIQGGFANAMLFNPVSSGQGSLVGTFYGLFGITLLFATDLHHSMLISVVESYRIFPATGILPDISSFSEAITRTVTEAFNIGVRIALPFLVVGLIAQAGFGVLGRLMPQIQIYFLALPVQILLSLIVMAVVLSAGMMFWLNYFSDSLGRTILP